MRSAGNPAHFTCNGAEEGGFPGANGAYDSNELRRTNLQGYISEPEGRLVASCPSSEAVDAFSDALRIYAHFQYCHYRFFSSQGGMVTERRSDPCLHSDVRVYSAPR